MKINIYGTKASALKFISRNVDVSINAFIDGKVDNDGNISVFFPFFNRKIRVFPHNQAKDVLSSFYTVVATSEDAYWEIKSKLENDYNLKEFENFEYYKTFRKKIALIYGNCHCDVIKEMLQTSAQFESVYGFYPLKAICDSKLHSNPEYYLASSLIKRASLVIHQCIRKNNYYGELYSSENFLRSINPSCKIIGIPNLFGLPKFLFPQYVLSDWHKKWGGDLFCGLNFFSCRDRYIDYYHSVKSTSDLVNMIMSDDFIPSRKVMILKEEFDQKINEREKDWDIKISDFIRNNLKNIKLFYDPYHPTNELLSYISNRILEKLFSSHYTNILYDNKMILNSQEIPVYSSVKKILGLTCYTDEHIRLGCSTKISSCPMGTEQYIKEYLWWYYGTDTLNLQNN